MERLLADYVKYGLPLPPDDPELVAVPSGWRSINKDGTETPHVHLAFVLKRGTDTSPAVLLVGTEEYVVPSGVAFHAVNIADADLRRYHVEWPNSAFDINCGLATALQFKAVGWGEKAEVLWNHSHTKGAGHHLSAFRLNDSAQPEAALVVTAWTHYANKLLLPKTDRKGIRKELNQLWKAHEIVRNARNEKLLKDLELTLKPSSETKGTPAWHIDQLTELSGGASIMCDSNTDANYMRLVELGFDAVPTLIEHLDDSRLTLSYMSAFNNFPPYHRRVGEICTDILRGLVNEDLGDGWLDRQRGITARRAEVRAWFDDAKRMGEQQYLLANVVTADAVQSQMLRILATKYPNTIPELYRQLLKSKSDGDPHELTDYISKSQLSNQEKVELLTAGATYSSLLHRNAALWALKDVDNALFLQFLVDTLDNLPRSPKAEYCSCVESSFANLVMETDASSAWTALRNAAHRSDVGLRMELLNPMNYDYIGDRNVKQRLQFLSSFLSDASIRDVTVAETKYEGPCAGMGFDRIAVRDFAALQIASILDFNDRPSTNWTDKQWLQFRAKAQAALSSHKALQP